MAAPGESGSMSWMSLLAASSHLMDEKIQSDCAMDPCGEVCAEHDLLCFERTGGDSLNIPSHADGEERHKTSLSKKFRSVKAPRYIRGIPAVSKRDIAWNLMFKRLQDFKYTTGHCNVPQGYTADLELATWVKNQRQAYRYMLDKKTDKKPTKRISPDRVTRLNHLGFEWRKYVRADEWTTTAGRRSASRQHVTAKHATNSVLVFEKMPPDSPSNESAAEQTITPELLCDEN